VKRALLAAALVALATATAAPATAKRPHVPPKPLQVTTSLAPPVALFGDTVTVRVSVIADTKRVDAARLRATASFAPYKPVGTPQKVQTGNGRYVQATWTWKLRCLTAACVPIAPPSDVFRDLAFPPVQVSAVRVNGKSAYRTHVFLPQLEVVSEVSPREDTYTISHKHVQWHYQLMPAAGDAYRLPPGLVFWLAVVLAGLCGAAALVLAGRWALGLRKPATETAALRGSSLERALALFFWADAHGDETLQRKALERVADELPLDVVDLSEVARKLAWSPETPEGDEVEAISERAGVAVHPEERNGA
jgi:hypothetical protein